MSLDNKDVDSWNSFTSNYLKAVNVASENDAYVCTAVDSEEGEDRKRLILTLERNEQDFKFDVNKTNANKFQELKVPSPRALIGKKIFFKKALARDPRLNKEVESLRIWKIE